MPQDNKKRAFDYGATVYAAIVIIAIAVSALVYKLVMSEPENIDSYVIENVDIPAVSPNEDLQPSAAPMVTPPTSAPPSS